MKRFLKNSTWSFSSVLARMVSGILINKLFAVRFGTAGITMLAHFQNLITLLTQIPNDGINRGIIRYWSDNRNDQGEKNKILAAGFWMNLLLFIAGISLVFLFRDYLLRYFNIDYKAWIPLVILAIILLIFLLNLFYLSVILSGQHIKTYAIIHIAGAFLLLLITWAGVRSGNMNYALASFLAGSAANILFTLYHISKHRLANLRYFSSSVKSFHLLGEFVLMAASVLVFGKGVDFYLRAYAISEFGMHQTGLWQAVAKISDGYMMVFINTVGIVYYPQISSLIFDTEQLRDYVRDVLKIVGIISISGFFILFLFRHPLIDILYSSDFYGAAELLPVQFAGDFFCILSYLLTYIISAQSKTRVFIMLQGFSAVFYIVMVHLMVPFMGIVSLPAAHAIRCVAYFIVLVILNKRILF